MQSLLLALAVLSTGCFGSHHGGVLFPTQTEVGLVSMTNGQHAQSGVRYKSSLSWASVSPNAKTPVDVGIGYQIDKFNGPKQSESSAIQGGEKRKGARGADEVTVFHGPIMELSKNMGGTKHRRQWVGARVEMPMRQINGKSYYGVGASLRASMEFLITMKSKVAIGALGVGSYVEGGVRKIPGGDNAFVMSTGLSLRLPLAAFH